MKVLWFSLFPGLSDVYLNDKATGGGWIKSLEKNIQDKIDLTIAFYHPKVVEPFALGRTNYFPIKSYQYGKLSKIKERLLNSIEGDYHLKSLLLVIDKVKPDLIHIHGTESVFGLVQQFVNVPTVVSIQGTITVYKYKYFSKISYFDVIRFSYVKSFLFFRTYIDLYKRFKKIEVREQRIYNHTKHFIGRTAWDRRITKVLAPAADYYHNDEILRGAFYENVWKYTPSGKLVLFTTNGADIYKGLETLLACATLLDNNKFDYEWHVAGLNRVDEVVNIAARTTGKPISPNIKFLGRLDEKSLVESLLRAHVYVATSHIENSPNSLCEAQILGLPCIAAHAGGTNSLLDDNVDGVLIQDGDPYSMAGAIVELQADYDNAILLGENARTRALLRHNPVKITNELLEIYKTILNKQTHI